jgi:hypothetical protein
MSARHFLSGITLGAALGAGAALSLGGSRGDDPPLAARSEQTPQAAPASVPINAQTPRPVSPQSQAQPATPASLPTGATALAQRPLNSGAIVSQRDQAHAVPVTGLSTEHAKLLLPTRQDREPVTVPELHARFAAESKEGSWAYGMEGAIRQFLAEAQIEPAFELLSVECRTSMCQILAFGNVPESQQRWNAIGADMTKQAWWTDFRGNATSSSDQNGRTVIATILQRRQR